MRYKTIKSVKLALHTRGGWLETVRDSELPEYAPHLPGDFSQEAWVHGIWVKDELLAWANQHLT